MILLLKRTLELGFCVLLFLCIRAEAYCRRGCDLAIASYYVWEGSNLTYISNIFSKPIPEILPYNPDIRNSDNIQAGTRVNVPFSCDCLNGDFLGHTFTYIFQFGDTYGKVAETAFANLTTEDWVQKVNHYPSTRIPDYVPINVTVNCSCGNEHVSMAYGLFATYPLRPGENLSSIAAAAGVSAELVQKYNLEMDFSQGSGIVFVPARGW
ncbi:hypothetical protein HHK36_023894 [Tetracentron sinense]|uniref:Uncharacterized protein n=1 Tax=Tetracentron sinense TaxID=13715 RepID=A0A835D5T8_TETSI|nr:hypothetical protein HHK36_023894 [Tetracentron sinense]